MNFEPFTFILERLAPVLIDEFKLLSADKKRLLEGLQQQLELAQSFIRDVDEEKQEASISHVLETEIQHIMQKLPQIEDFLDNLHLEELQQSQEPSCFPKFMACFSCTSNPLARRHFVIDQALQLTQDLRETRERALPYQRPGNRPREIRKRRPLAQPHIINDEFIVGLDKDVETLVAKLVGDDGEHIKLLAIAGMGGSGKTTLARKLYNHRDIIGHFICCHAWVCVSQEWDATQLLCQICEQVGVPLAEGEASIANLKLQKFLQGNSYFIVLDDVWKMEALQELLPSLLSEGSSKGSGRVLVTTRNEKILSYPALSGVHIHQARFLTPEESWDLFSKIVRNKWQGIRSFHDGSKFAKLGKEMLEKCNGLPLAIVALAGLLSTKGTIQEWETLKNNVMSMILIQNTAFHDYGPVKEMLELSYSDMPYDLKSCFLYLGIFPEDAQIESDNLIRLWIGEGFLRTDMCNDGQTLEELGRDFIDELVQRCMVQDINRDYEGKVNYIRVHDLIRELCMEKERILRIFHISSPSTFGSTSTGPVSSRTIIHNRWSHSLCNPRLRSFIILSCSYKDVIKWAEFPHKQMKLLRVLHLQRVCLEDSAKEIGNLILLRYLSIKSCDGVTNILLESIKKLKNLLTLEARLNYEITIPNNMVGGMKHLRYLNLRNVPIQGPILGVKTSRSLQHLSCMGGEWLSNELCSMIDTLGELFLQSVDSKAQWDAISDFVNNPSNHLQMLTLDFEEVSGFDFQMPKLECCSRLKWLQLGGPIRKLPESFFFPPNLLHLDLNESGIEKEEILVRALAQLDQLRHLSLGRASYLGEKLTMTGLPQLENLEVRELDNLKEWRIEEGALRRLNYLCICSCKQLERIPEGLSGILTLRRLLTMSMSESFCNRLRLPSEKEDKGEGGDGGEDFHLICHIPDIRIS